MTLSEDNISRIQCERTFTIYYVSIRRYFSSVVQNQVCSQYKADHMCRGENQLTTICFITKN